MIKLQTVYSQYLLDISISIFYLKFNESVMELQVSVNLLYTRNFMKI